MKTSIWAVSACVIIGASLTSCGNSTTSTTHTVSSDTIRTSDSTVQISTVEIDTYRKQYNDSIAANQRSIDELNARIADEKAERREEDKKRAAELETKNSEMKRKLDEFKASTKADWESFKTGFNHDMHELGQSIKDFKNKL